MRTLLLTMCLFLMHLLLAENPVNPFDANVGDFLDVDRSEDYQSATQAYQDGEYEKACINYLNVLKYDITDESMIYNLACCYGLLGKDELAAKFLMRAYKRGFKDIDHIKWDPDFEKVRGSKPFDTVVDSIAKVVKKSSFDGKKLYIKSNVTLPCNIALPENFDSVKSYPLVVGLHGYGASPDNFIKVKAKMGFDELIYATPQAPYYRTGSKDPSYSWFDFLPEDDPLADKGRDLAMEYVLATVEHLQSTFNVDEIYLFGFSQGAGLTLSIGLKNPNKFDKLVAFGGWLDTNYVSTEDLENAKEMDIFLGHGKDDKVVEYSNSVNAHDVLKQHGIKVKLSDFEGGHSIKAENLQEAFQDLKPESRKSNE